MISKMLDDGYAYISNGNVYFDISKADSYYELSGKNPDDLKIGVRDTVSLDSSKKNPMDFVLWFTLSKFENQIMKWDSPWGVGYPGWHIECSGISYKIFGDYLDIHHTNEIAQSEAFLGHKWCNYWCHGAHLNDESGKMSKSNGEFLTVSLLEKKGYSPLDYRFFCLNSHYRNSLVFTYDSLDIARNAYKKVKNKVSLLKEEGDIQKDLFDKYRGMFCDAISNDLNTSSMITVLYDVLKANELNNTTKIELLKDFDKVLSLDLFVEDDSSIDKDFEEYITNMINERNEAKKNKDYARADEIRNTLLEKKVKLIDTREGTTFELM